MWLILLLIFLRGSLAIDLPDVACTAFAAFVDGLILLVKTITPMTELLEAMATEICGWSKLTMIAKYKVTDKTCRQTVKIHFEPLVYVLKNNPDCKRLVALLFQPWGCFETRHFWSVNINVQPQSMVATIRQGNPRKRPLKILHISDIHHDPEYQIGSHALCQETLCCSSKSTPIPLETKRAGPYSDYDSCDTPMHMIDELFQELSKQKYDYIYFTGDIVDHRFWMTSIKRNTDMIRIMMKKFRQYFGNATFFPILGNHDLHPLNLCAPESLKNTSLSSQWVFDLYAEEWQHWLPKETQETIWKGGFYTVKVKDGLRIIALNSNTAYVFNYYLLLQEEDPYGQLQWFADTLQKAEDDGEIVHILTHIPSGDRYTYIPWALEYSRIIERYSHIIAGQFCGHTHMNEINLYFNKKNKPISVMWNGGSLSTWQFVNPNYRIFTADSQNFELMDYDEYILDIAKANKFPSLLPKWTLLYSFKQMYQVENLSPLQVYDLAKRMRIDETLRQNYNILKMRNTTWSYKCGIKCQKENLQGMVSSVYNSPIGKTFSNKWPWLWFLP